MINRLLLHGVTAFPQHESFDFVNGVNVIVGGNDSGKSHLLKLSYTLAHWMSNHGGRTMPEQYVEERGLRKELLRVFGISSLASLCSHQRQITHAQLSASFSGERAPVGSSELRCRFYPSPDQRGLKIERMPDRFPIENALFIAAREVLSIFPHYAQGASRYPGLIDGVSLRLCQALDHARLKQAVTGSLSEARRLIERLLGGELLRQQARFYLNRPTQGQIELNLLAEGFKRMGTLALLIDNGSLRAGTMLFWDEPEMNLNASHLPLLVRIMLCLCEAGVQLIMSTHSLFLLRELTIQLHKHQEIARRFIGLQPQASHSDAVQVSAADSLDELPHLESLDAELAQADRYLCMGVTALSRDDAAEQECYHESWRDKQEGGQL